MSFFLEKGFGQLQLGKLNLGPIALHEHMYYFKEVFPGKPIRVSLQLKGISENGMFFEFTHNFYDVDGKNVARCEMLGAWINLKERRLTALPIDLFKHLEGLDKTEDFKILSKEDTRRFGQLPKDL
jgi:acyl-CoA thioester hydrolase